jgi:putative ABC transport system permease protein
VLAIVRSDLLTGWQNRLPEDAPNQFLINIQSGEVESLREFFSDRGLQSPEIFPMIRARLSRINGRHVGADDYQDARAKRLVSREFNLSWAASMQADNKLVAGTWWTPAQHDASLLSVEEGIAETLGIQLGDMLTYRIADQEISAQVSSLRSVEWDSFNANFFVVAPPELLRDFPATWMTSFHLAGENKAILNQLVREFPSVTVLDVAAIMNQIRLIMERVTLAVEYVFMFTLLAGFTVMLAAIQSTHDQRIQETAILRLLGADNKRILMGLFTEFCALGMVAGTVAASAASLIAYGLSVHVFNMEYQPNILLWITGISSGTLSVVIIGLLGTRSVLTHAPIITLGKV